MASSSTSWASAVHLSSKYPFVTTSFGVCANGFICSVPSDICLRQFYNMCSESGNSNGDYADPKSYGRNACQQWSITVGTIDYNGVNANSGLM